MSNKINRQIILAKRPSGKPQPADFSLVDASFTVLLLCHVLFNTIFLSLDPYMRGRFNY
jgi:NADPH-dependent curcumin reductase CurA